MTDHETTTAPDRAAETAAAAPLLLSQHVAASPETVFDFLVDPDKAVRWLGTAIEIEPRVGGRFWINANGQDTAAGVYREVVRPERVSFTFGWEGSDDVAPGSTTVTITLERAEDDTTIVHLRHDGLPLGPEDSHAQGWTYFLGRLAEAAAGGDPGPIDH